MGKHTKRHVSFESRFSFVEGALHPKAMFEGGDPRLNPRPGAAAAALSLCRSVKSLIWCRRPSSSTTSIVRCQRSSCVVFSSPKCSTRRCNTRLRLIRKLSQSE